MSEQKKRNPARGGRRSDHSRDEIQALAISAAKKIAQQEGLSGLSARKIANEIGYNVAMLYHFFDNLDHIILKVNAQTLTDLFQFLLQASEKCRQPRTCIISLGHAYIDFALNHRNLWNMIFEHSLPDNTEVPDWYQEKVDRIFNLVEEMIKPMSDDISARKLEQAAHALWCGVHGICVLAVTRKLPMEDKDVHTLTESLINNYLIGLTSKT